ncbi:hypothetical protein QFC20_004026 [Naganishia adeliensis]|uniref:Uncharacterized protein n=1 Tax=Naganishia adeliensis TaxID=92952 RepID=A0ACC2W6F2_9TREE|nr:hypothetical protein QFC20_004026 [Naganishia adeliensis]
MSQSLRRAWTLNKAYINDSTALTAAFGFRMGGRRSNSALSWTASPVEDNQGVLWPWSGMGVDCIQPGYPLLVRFEMDIARQPGNQHSRPSLRQRFCCNAQAIIVRPLHRTFFAIFREAEHKLGGLVQIRQECEAMFTISLVNDKTDDPTNPEPSVFVDLGLYEDSEDEDYDYINPAPKFIMAKLEDL